MSVDNKLKAGNFVLIRRGTEAFGEGEIKFGGNVVGLIQKVEGKYAKVNVAFQNQDLTLTYRLADLHKY